MQVLRAIVLGDCGLFRRHISYGISVMADQLWHISYGILLGDCGLFRRAMAKQDTAYHN